MKFQGRVQKKYLYIFPRLVVMSGSITTDYVDVLGSVISIQTSEMVLSLHCQHSFYSVGKMLNVKIPLAVSGLTFVLQILEASHVF